MRSAMTILAMACTLSTWWSGAAWALTSGPVCRRECAPRVEEQCGGRTGRQLRRCRRPLIRACKATSPAVACLTTADLTRNLGDRRINPTARKGPVFVIDPDRGTWSVEVSNGVAELRTVDAPSGDEQRLTLELSDDGTALVNGAAPASSPDLVGRVCR